MLAFIQGEPGGEIVQNHLPVGNISTVNIAECITKLVDRSGCADIAVKRMRAIRLVTHAFSTSQAEVAGRLREATKQFGLSLGDRACLALALELSAPVLTTDAVWAKLDVGVEVRLIR